MKDMELKRSKLLLKLNFPSTRNRNNIIPILSDINIEKRKYLEVEDPPEYVIKSVIQNPINREKTNEKQQNRFEDFLKSTMRLKPEHIYIIK